MGLEQEPHSYFCGMHDEGNDDSSRDFLALVLSFKLQPKNSTLDLVYGERKGDRNFQLHMKAAGAKI
jgi:hypothetical protein